jgi:O-antigen/teichoic acid export membrane protein
MIGQSEFKLLASFNSFALIMAIIANAVLIYFYEITGAYLAIGVTSLTYLLSMFGAYEFKHRNS